MAITFEFSNPPYAWCNGTYYNIGDTIEEPAGTVVTFFADIKCLGLVGGGPCGRGRFSVIWDNIVKCNSGYEWYCNDTPHTNLTCTKEIPSSQKSVRFCASSETICYDPKCCITLKPTAAPEPKFEFVDADCYMNCGANSCGKNETKYCQVGERVTAQAKIKNVGTAAGAPTLKVYHYSTKLCEDTFSNISPGYSRSVSKSCFNMPDANRYIKMKVYYGSRLDDTVETFNLKPSAVKEDTRLTISANKTTLQTGETVTLTGSLKTVSGVGVSYTWLDLYIAGVKYSDAIQTDSSGNYSYAHIETTPKTVQFYTSFAGDEDYNPSRSSKIYVTWEEATCSQPFKVEDQNGDPVNGAGVKVKQFASDLGTCTTNSSGECTVTSIPKGEPNVSGEIYSLPSGYTYPPTGWKEDFTPCELQILLYAEKIEITCDDPTPNFDSGCALLLHFDTDHDGIISLAEKDAAWEVESRGLITDKEAHFVEDAYDAGSINNLCEGCFVAPSLVISPTTRSSPAAGETFTITVTSNIDWTVVNVDSRPWISFTPTSGSGNGTITVTVAENLLAERTGTIRVAGSGMTPTCTVTQASGLPVKEDTILCDFDILDADDNVVTDLYAGVQYWVRAWLCKVEGGGCAEILKGCDSGCEIPSEELKLFLLGQAASEATGTTNENGYTAFAWTPSEDIGSVEGLDNSIRVVFAGSAGYNSSETAWKTVTVKLLPYTINVTVNDQDGNPLEGAYVDIDGCVISCIEKKCTDGDVAVYVGECKEEEWKGDGYNVVTASTGVDKGKVSIGLPVTEATGRTVGKWRIRVGKPGYLNKDVNGHEDWTEFKDAKGAGTHNLEFALTFITIEDKFIVHTKGFKDGDKVSCVEAYEWSKCFVFKPLGVKVTKTPSSYPDGIVEFTTADGFTDGMTCGIGPIIEIVGGWDFAIGPAWCGGFSGIRDVSIPRYGPAGILCDFFGIDAASDECRRFWAEMIDPIYCANCITGVLKGEDVYGAEYHPGTFELAMFPVVVACSFVPFIPGAKITKFLGKFLRKGVKYGDDILAVRKYFEDDYLDIYRIQAYGDDPRLTNWAKAIEKGDIDGPDGARAWMRKILDDPAVLDADSVGYFDSMLNELTKQIDTIDPKHVDEIADLRARVIETANACMDDVTDFTRVYDEKYTEFVDVARRGSDDTIVRTFVRAVDCACSPTLMDCKFSVIMVGNKLKVGDETLSLLEYTKFLYKHNATSDADDAFRNALRYLAVSDEADITSLNALIKADDWAGMTSWRGKIMLKFDDDYVKQADHFYKQRCQLLDIWADERCVEIWAHSGFQDEVSGFLRGLADNVPETKKVMGDVDAYPRVIALTAGAEPDDAAKTIVKLMDNAPDVEHNVLFGGMWVSMEKATSLGYLGKGRVSRWTDDLVHAAMDNPEVYAYLKYDRPRVIEAIGKAELSKVDDFVDALKRGDIDGARIKLDDATKATPVGSIDRTYGIVRETEKVLDDVVPPATPYTRAQIREMLDETCENVYMLLAKTPDDMKRVVTGAELDSLRQIFQRAARRIIDRTSGGLKKLRRKRPDLDTPEGDLYSTTLRNGKIISETYKMPPKEVRNFFWRHWKAIGGIAAAAVIMVPWWAVDNAVFMVYMGREGGWIDKLWGNRWMDAYWRIVNASEKMELDPCVKSHQELYVGALEEMYELLQVDPLLPGKAESLGYNYMVQWGFTPSQPSETFKDQCYQQFNSDNARYFQIVQHCPSPVEPYFGFAITEMPEVFPALSSTIEDADTLYVIPPDEDPSGDELYWEHGNPILVRLVGINSPEGPNYYYSCTGKKKPYLVRRLVTPYEECISEELWTVDSIFYAQANAWLASQLPKDTHVTLRSDKDRQWLTKYKKIRFLAAVYKGTTNIDVEELKAGYAVLFIIEKNKQIWDIANDKIKAEYVNAENVAKLKKTRIWDPKWAKPCPATEVWYNNTTPVRVGEEATFKGEVLGCAPSEITDWTWTGFPDGVVRTGREVKYTYSEEWSGKIYLEICTGALNAFRTITVKAKRTDRKSPCIPFGNVNGDTDDYVNDLDAALVQRYIEKGWDDVESEVATGIDETEFKRRANVDNDDEVTQNDVDMIYEFYEGPSIRNSFPVCPGECPTPSVDFSFKPTSPIVGQEVLFACKSSGGDKPGGGTYNIVKRKWDFGDGTGDEDNHGLVTHTYSKAEKYDVYLTVTNDCETGESKKLKKRITVSEKPIPPPPKGDLTIITYATRKFATPLAVETFYIDGATVAGTYSCTKTNLLVSENPHTVKIDFKDAPHTCYVDTLDECFDTCEFSINIVKDTTTVIKVCPARGCLFLSDPSGASIYIKQVDAPSEDYEEISASYVLPLGTYNVRFSGLAGYGALEAVISVRKDKVICESVTTAGGHCYTDPTLVTRPGLLVSGFLIKSFPPEAVTKTVTFESVPTGALITVLD